MITPRRAETYASIRRQTGGVRIESRLCLSACLPRASDEMMLLNVMMMMMMMLFGVQFAVSTLCAHRARQHASKYAFAQTQTTTLSMAAAAAGAAAAAAAELTCELQALSIYKIHNMCIECIECYTSAHNLDFASAMHSLVVQADAMVMVGRINNTIFACRRLSRELAQL